ncbi:MAG: thioredoxin domain-containing protein, partial [Sciscionella sp.]
PIGAATSPLPQFDTVLGRLVAALGERFDQAWGGFGPAPKFPRPVLVELCLRHHQMASDPDSLAMATTTLDAMAAGGIYDHLAGGFARYSTDRQWLVPHFEKMLTDQALLARAYLHAWQATGSDHYLQVVAETLDWVCDELSASSGGLCSSVDADAAGEEGGHATWTPGEVAAAMRDEGLADLAPAVCDWYGVVEGGNWEGRTVLRRPLRAPLRRPPEIESARRTLLAARRKRAQPSRDDKVLTEWNAMFIAVLAEAAGACDDQRWGERAEAEAEALLTRNRRRDGRLLRSADNPAVGAFAADYAWVIECCTRLGELTGRAVWTERAAETAGDMLDLF